MITYSETKLTSGTFVVKEGMVIDAENFVMDGYKITMKDGKIESDTAKE